jgi:hypothetical protein
VLSLTGSSCCESQPDIVNDPDAVGVPELGFERGPDLLEERLATVVMDRLEERLREQLEPVRDVPR